MFLKEPSAQWWRYLSYNALSAEARVTCLLTSPIQREKGRIMKCLIMWASVINVLSIFLLQIENYIELELLQDFNAFELTTNTGSGSLIVDVRVIDNTYLDYEVRQQVNFTVSIAPYPRTETK